jgi:hypothetical protein
MKTKINSIIRCLLFPGLLSSLLACQGASTPGENDRQTAFPPAAAETAAPAGTPGAGPAGTGPTGLAGLVFYASDVSGQPDQPLAGQLLMAVPAARAGEILGTGPGELTDAQLRFLKADLPRRDPASAVTLSDAAGKYTLLLDPGEYVLCVLDAEATPPDFPATTRGCGRTQVMPGELRRVDISSGFGEILLVEQ